jgi:metal-responsive CopG/Arc/MetJ family transcriptional regulator
VAFLVSVPKAADRTVRVNMTLPERLLRRIDERAKNRSTFLARAAEKALEES